VTSYSGAGVDIPAYAVMLERVKPLIAATHGPQVATGVGPFAGTYALPDGAGHLAASADGVGTKTKVAVAYGTHRGIGHDLVNHCVNDVATAGAAPLFLLDYFASGRLDPAVFEEVVAGLAEACRASGCALLGGETAEMPDVYAPGDYDLAGFVVGHIPSSHRPACTPTASPSSGASSRTCRSTPSSPSSVAPWGRSCSRPTSPTWRRCGICPGRGPRT
jgi:phosphoribosylformylglycinamidine cyclo-ligase